MARPPEMMILAEVSSGRSDFESSSPIKPESPGSAAAVTGSIGAGAPPAPVAWKAAVRTVITRFRSPERTVCTALPA